MWRFFLGIILGIALGFVPFWKEKGGIEIYPEWTGSIESPEQIKTSPNPSISSIRLPPVAVPGKLMVLNGDGHITHRQISKKKLITHSGNGHYYALYEKVGKDIEFYDIEGVRYWKLKSQEYPYLSYNARLILLMSSDHSRIRIYDYNGNQINDNPVTGRFATILAFSDKRDWAGLGFLDGSYYIVNNNGTLLFSGMTHDRGLIKSMALSRQGNYHAIHHGSNTGDFVTIINTENEKSHTTSISGNHLTKTPLYIGPRGTTAILDFDKIIIINRKGSIQKEIRVPTAREGFGSLDSNGRQYAAGYTRTNGISQLILFYLNGNILFTKEFPDESFLKVSFTGPLLFVRGSHNLYCYSILN